MNPERLAPDTPISGVDWIPPNRQRQLERLGHHTLADLLTHFPRRYEDRMQFDRFPSDESPDAVCVRGVVAKTAMKRFGGWKKIYEVTLEEHGGSLMTPPLVCRWFNAHWVQKMIATGQELVVYGRPKRNGPRIVIDHPEFEVVEEGEETSIHLNRITPIHRASEGISARVIRTLIFRALEAVDLPALTSPLPPGLGKMPWGDALREIHFPATWDAQAQARRELVMGEFFQMQLFVAARRAEHRAAERPPRAGISGDLVRRFHDGLPFPLTKAQERANAEIRGDLEGRHPMNRLLHGDVGSGKTVVALSAMLRTVEAGFQAALMAPTQILAEQHYLTCRRWLEPLGIRLALRTGARQEETALPLFDAVANPETCSQIIIGTHALLFDGAQFEKLGLAVIDEQHKFGVLQRARLSEKGDAPDILVMTATPIPRTLTMTLYGDLDVSTLDEMPAGRGKIVTAVRPESKLPEAVKFIAEHLDEGRQAYIVYPLVEESEKLEAKAAAAEFERWSQWLAPRKCELLTGRTEPAEKDAIMDRFRKGETQVLVATTVIEVGIDVPNATLMLIENAERFGLAQLHQLRGRIGRGEHKSYCLLIHAKKAEEAALQKLAILEETRDGFKIAEADLRMRGPGDLLGTKQSGLPPLKLGDPIEDAALMQEAREAARKLFAGDPALTRPENQRFRDLLVESRKLVLSQVS